MFLISTLISSSEENKLQVLKLYLRVGDTKVSKTTYLHTIFKMLSAKIMSKVVGHYTMSSSVVCVITNLWTLANDNAILELIKGSGHYWY